MDTTETTARELRRMHRRFETRLLAITLTAAVVLVAFAGTAQASDPAWPWASVAAVSATQVERAPDVEARLPARLAYWAARGIAPARWQSDPGYPDCAERITIWRATGLVHDGKRITAIAAPWLCAITVNAEMSLSPAQKCAVELHELGHVLGLNHDDARFPVMDEEWHRHIPRECRGASPASRRASGRRRARSPHIAVRTGRMR